MADPDSNEFCIETTLHFRGYPKDHETQEEIALAE